MGSIASYLNQYCSKIVVRKIFIIKRGSYFFKLFSIKMIRMIFLVLILPLFLPLVTGQSISSCTNQNTCNECIQTKGCFWCLKLTFGFEDSPRCLSTDSMNGSCERNFIENPINEHNITMRKPLTQRWPTKGQEIVQIYPQRMSLKLRISKFCFSNKGI